MTTSTRAEAVRRDAAALLDAYRTGSYTPSAAERDLAEGLARSRWSGYVFRAALRGLPPTARTGRLIDVLEPATDVLDQAVDSEETILRLRVLVDALTAAP